MANAQAVTVASQQNNFEPKAVDAEGHETGRGLNDNRISIKSTACERFTIRGYVATIRQRDRNTCWPFPQHLLETRLKEAGNMALPPLEIPDYRWWNCENCLGDISISGDSPCAKEYMRDSQTSILTCVSKLDRRSLMSGMHLPTSSVDIQENLKENMLDDTGVAESLTVELKSGGALGSSSYQTGKERKDEGIVTDCTREHVRTENTVPMELENDKSEIADLDKDLGGTSHCLSNSRSDEEVINMTDSCPREQNQNAVSDDVVQAVMETMSSMLLSKKRNELDSKQNKSEQLQILVQSPNSWEYFSRNKNVFKEISEKMKGKEKEQTISSDANQPKSIRNVPVSIPYAENIEPGQRVIEGGDERTISISDSLRIGTMKSNIHNGDDPHRGSDTRIDVPFSNSNDSSSSDHMNINKITEAWTELSNSQFSLEKENVLLTEQTMKLKVSESRSKRKPQKMRSIADIIASKPSCPESWNKEPEECKSHDEKEENICMTDNNEKSPRPREYHMEVTIDHVKNSSKPTIDRNGISEVNSDAEINSIIVTKQRPEKLEVRKKHPGVRTESLSAGSTFVAKNSSTSSLSEAVTNALQMPQGSSSFWLASSDKAPQHDFLNPENEHTNALQMPQGSSIFWSASSDKAPQHDFLSPENEQNRQKLSVMEDEIPMDIVELMAKNQHERGLLNLKHFHGSHNLQKERTGLNMKKAATSQVNQHEGGRTGLKQKTAKIKTQPKQTGKGNLLASSKNQCQRDLLVGYGQIDVSRALTDNSIISDKEGITYSSCEGDMTRTQSTQWFNPWEKFSGDFVAPVLDETVSACNLPFPIDGTKSHVPNTQYHQYGSFCTNSMAVDSMQLRGVSPYCGNMQMQNLCREGTPALPGFTGSVLPIFQNKFESSNNHNGHSNLNLTGTDNPQLFTGQTSHLENSGKTFDIPSESHKGNAIPNLSIRKDGGSGIIYFNGQSNSALLQQVNAQARQPFGKNYCFPTTPGLRLMGQSVSVPANCGNEARMVTDSRDNRHFSHLSQASPQNHFGRFHSSGVTETIQKETLSATGRVFTGSESIQDSIYMNGQTTSSIKPIPPVPKFRPSGHYASKWLFGISIPSSTITGNAEVALEGTKSALGGTLLSGKKRKKELEHTNTYNNGNLQIFSTTPPASQSTKVVKGSSSTKGLRSYRSAPMSMHRKGNHRSALDRFLENPQQNVTMEAEKAKGPKLIKENEQSSFCGEKVSNLEICTLNQNPAEISVAGKDDRYRSGYEHFTLFSRDIGHGEPKIDMAIPQGKKRRRTIKKKHMQEFLNQKYGYVGDPAKTNVDNLDIWGRNLLMLKN